MNKNPVLEVCVDSLESALAAKAGDASRLELCSNLVIGGTTPSLVLLRKVKEETELPVHALLRPRFGDFLYTRREFSQMLEEGEALLEAGADALVSGFLTPQGDVDGQRTRQLATLSHDRGKKFTFHRAFDLCRDPFAALSLCRELGVDSILTSGQEETCVKGIPLLKALEPQLGGVELLIGGGVNDLAIRQVKKEIPKAFSFHMSGKRVEKSAMEYRKEGVSMGLPSLSEYEIWRADEKKIRAAWEELTRWTCPQS